MGKGRRRTIWPNFFFQLIDFVKIGCMSGGGAGVPFPAFIGRKVHIFIGNAENEANHVMMLVLRVF